ncbi:MAG: peptidoglycan-binding protein [Nitrosomonas sp.]|uniref:peptidoglycan-binding domain-containing protein n=1 Tax=Nitrosomonas sp. TaxID=42353 RepID=UPI0025D25E30|nr:peptidoglycan-binding domain-containing protein [Nitrosomonas sp.]MBY0474721.1 peptidoglycan-binding protein [Nitrosomonas sp.]
MLEILIAVFLIYALFSGLVSGVNELIIQWLEMRGKVLFEGIAMMLGELPKKTYKPGIFKPFFIKDASLTEDLYKHPLIDSLSPAGGTRPSYISSATFSAVLVQTLSNDGSLAALRQKLDDRNTHLGKLFGPMLDEANGDLEKFKTKLEAHFNEVMDRVGGWYKRRAQVALFTIGLALAVLFNVDSIHIMQQLQKDPAQVEKLVQMAEAKMQAIEEQNQKSNANVDAVSEVDKSVDVNIKAQFADLKSQFEAFNNLTLPIGWAFSDQSDSFLDSFDYPAQQNRSLSLLGWLLTALAATLGAPFWFDAISKLFTIRGAGKKPDESATASATPIVQVVTSPENGTVVHDIQLNDFEASRLNGDDIEGLQRALGIPAAKINGKFSEELRNSLREWQRITGKTVTGQFDEPTVLALLYPESGGK